MDDDRQSGYYWVKDRLRRDWAAPHDSGWRIAYWNATSRWWVLGFVAFDESPEPPSDARFEEIGSKIDPPDYHFPV